MFFIEFIFGLLDSNGIFGFFNGFGVDWMICYDVYIKVLEFYFVDVGFDVEWKVIDVDMFWLVEEG